MGAGQESEQSNFAADGWDHGVKVSRLSPYIKKFGTLAEKMEVEGDSDWDLTHVKW